MACFRLKINELHVPSCLAGTSSEHSLLMTWGSVFKGTHWTPYTITAGSKCHTELVTRNGFRFADHTCKVVHLTAPRSQARSLPTVRIGNTLLPVEDSTKFLGLWWDSYLAFIKHNSVLKTEVPRGSKPHLSGRSLEVGRGQRHTSDAVLGHCSLQAGLWLHCAWNNEHQSVTTGQRA